MMDTLQKQKSILAKIAQQLNGEKLSWAVGASMMLRLRGLPMEVHDLDLMTTTEDFDRVKAVLLTMGNIQPSRPGGKYRTECFAEFVVDGVDVDLLAGFAVEKDGVVYRFPLKAEDTLDKVTVEGNVVPLQSTAFWRGCYEAMGRGEKVQQIDCWAR